MEVHGHVHILEIPLTGCIPELPTYAEILIVDYICQGASVLSTSQKPTLLYVRFCGCGQTIQTDVGKLP